MTLTQRWLFGEPSFRPGDEPVRATDYEVVHVTEHARAKAFLQAHHYTGSMGAAREVFEVVHVPTLLMVGTAVFGQPINNAVLDFLPGERQEKLELLRFTLLDWVPGNAETMVLAECFRHLKREDYTGVVSHSDPVPREAASGRLLFPGHIGIIYQGLSATYSGLTRARWRYLFPDGKELNERTVSKLRAVEKGWESAAALLVSYGATPLELGVDWKAATDAHRAQAAAWVDGWRKALTRPLWHTGCHRYVWALTRGMRRHLPEGRPYPRLPTGRAAPRYGRRARALEAAA